MKITITLEDENGEETAHELPAHWEICDRCNGEGTHDPEAFSQGFTREDFAEDPDFADDYLAGRYDVSCEVCAGTGKVKCVAADDFNEAQRAVYVAHIRRQAEDARSGAADDFTRRQENGIF